MQLVRLPLAAAGPDIRMVESLAPMWAEEAARCGGSGIPAAPPSPPRSPQPLGHAVAAVRSQFEEVVAGQQPAPPPLSPAALGPPHDEQAQQAQQAPAGTPAGQPAAAAGDGDEAVAATPAAVPQRNGGALSTPAVQGTPLLALTQAANQAALAHALPGQQSGMQGMSLLPPAPTPTPLPAPLDLPAFEATANQQRLELHPQADAAATPAAAGAGAAAGEQTPATPALGLFAPPTQQRPQGWQVGATPMLDEKLLMTQLTEQRLQAARWPLSHPRRQGPTPRQQAEGDSDHGAPGWEQGQGQLPLGLDADAWAYLQASLPYRKGSYPSTWAMEPPTFCHSTY